MAWPLQGCLGGMRNSTVHRIGRRTGSCQFSMDLVSVDILFLQRSPFN